MRTISTTSVFILFAACAVSAQNNRSDFQQQYKTLETNEWGLSESERLHQLFELDWEYNMATYPEWATWEGRYERNGEWTDNSMNGIERRRKEELWSYAVLQSIDRSELDEADQLNYDLYRRQAERSIEGHAFPGEYMPVNQLGGVHQRLPRILKVMPKRNASDYEDILMRMNGIPVLVENTIALMRQGLEAGVTPPRVTLRDIPEQIKNILTDDPTESPIYEPFRTMPEGMSEKQAMLLQERAVRMYRERVAPALWSLHDFMVNTYIPGARESIGLGALPEGKAWYAYEVEGYTTTSMTPEEIFELGNREVKRIRAEMEKLVEESGFDGTLPEFEEFIRTDPQFFYTKKEDLLRGYRDICKRADPELAKLFRTLPRLPYGVIPVPSYMEKSQTTAYYQGGSRETGRPGYFYANTYDLNSRPKWEMEALALHEAVPGHHLQIAIADEQEELPKWRRDGGYTAYVEGWGLYAESLGEEMGFYQDPYSKYGQLSYEIWRAIRLVVDVGIHELGWTRDQAIDFFAANSGKPRHDIEVEIDRYIVWPGQALAYKIGELKIKELRARAEGELGDRFDVRLFHDEVLRNGALPLEVLERNIDAWIQEQQTESNGSGSSG